jgi:hypothetical protein
LEQLLLGENNPEKIRKASFLLTVFYLSQVIRLNATC